VSGQGMNRKESTAAWIRRLSLVSMLASEVLRRSFVWRVLGITELVLILELIASGFRVEFPCAPIAVARAL